MYIYIDIHNIIYIYTHIYRVYFLLLLFTTALYLLALRLGQLHGLLCKVRVAFTCAVLAFVAQMVRLPMSREIGVFKRWSL